MFLMSTISNKHLLTMNIEISGNLSLAQGQKRFQIRIEFTFFLTITPCWGIQVTIFSFSSPMGICCFKNKRNMLIGESWPCFKFIKFSLDVFRGSLWTHFWSGEFNPQ